MAQESYIGIDIGTSTIEIAFYDDQQSQVVSYNFDSDKPFFPTYFATHKTSGNEMYGNAAQQKIGMKSYDVVFEVKRFIGKKMNHPEVTKIKKKYFFDLEKLPNQSVGVKMTTKEGIQVLSPIEVYARIFKHIFGKLQNMIHTTKAVVCVPVKFGDFERQLIHDMFIQQLGFTDVHLINEPTAAAIDYFNGKQETGYYAVFDYGGGTLDVSVLEFKKSNNDLSCNVIRHDGLAWNGGADIDRKLIEYCLENFIEGDENADALKEYFTTNTKGRSIIKRVVEEAKIELTTNELANVNLKVTVQGEEMGDEYVIKREEFNEACKDLFNEAIDKLYKVIRESEVDVKEIIMVGGSSQIPYIKERIEKVCKRPAYLSENPWLAVSRGAAYKGRNIRMEKDLDIERSTYSVNLRVVGKDVSFPKFIELIPINVELPYTKEHRLAVRVDSQTTSIIKLYQDVSGTYTPKVDHLEIGSCEVFMPDGLKQGDRVLLRTVMNPEGRLDLAFTFVYGNGMEQKTTTSVVLQPIFK